MSQTQRENIELDINLQKEAIELQENQQAKESLENQEDVHMDICLPSELEAQTNTPRKGLLRSNIEGLLKGYCEMTSAASSLRKRWMILLSVFVCSMSALEIKETERLIPILFLVGYVCLGYQIFENIFRYQHLKRADLAYEKVECLFEMTDKTVLVLFISSLNLSYYGIISQTFMLLTPSLFLLETQMYLKNPLIKQSQDRNLEIFERIFYLVQSFLIAAKMNNFIDSDWKWVLALLWINLGLHAILVILTILLLVSVVLSAILNIDAETLGLFKNKALGYLWHILYNSLINVVGLVLIGVFEKIEFNEDETMKIGLLYVKKFSAFLLIFSAILFPFLKNSCASPFEDLCTMFQSQIAAVPQKKFSLQETENNGRKIAFFLMISPTYFNLLPDISQQQVKEIMQNNNESELETASSSGIQKQHEDVDISLHDKEENLCYICENNVSDAILIDCGHGGVCCECAIKSIEQKNECMECRKSIKTIYKIENDHSKNGQKVIVQAYEFAQVFEV